MQSTPWGKQTFDPMGRLTRIEDNGGGSRMDFTYDFAGVRVTARSSGAIAPAVDRVTPDLLYAVESGVLVLHFFDGRNICARRPAGGAVTFLHTDHLGSLVVVTDNNGAVVDTLRYDPFGALRERTGAGAPQPIGYISGTSDLFSGLLYLKARYYNPSLGYIKSASNHTAANSDGGAVEETGS